MPAIPSPRVDASQAANAQPSSPPGLPSEYHRRIDNSSSLCPVEVQAASTLLMPSASSVILPSGNSAPSQGKFNQVDAEKGLSKEVQVLPGDIQQTIGQEGNMPDPVGASADLSYVVKEQAGTPSTKVPAVLQASTTSCQTDTSPGSVIRPDAMPQVGQSEPVGAALPELSPRQRLPRPEHRVALPDIDKEGTRFEQTSLNHIIKNMTLLYAEGHSMFQQAREWNMDAEILARQAAGHYLTNHNRYHYLNGGNPPCKGFGNWLLWYVASVLAPGFKANISTPTTGGSFMGMDGG